MSLPDSTHSAALDAAVIKPVWFAFLDFVGDPVRANTSGKDIVPSGSGDADLDGETFVGISGELVAVSPVKIGPGGSETVTAQLSGIPGLDDDEIALLATNGVSVVACTAMRRGEARPNSCSRVSGRTPFLATASSTSCRVSCTCMCTGTSSSSASVAIRCKAASSTV